MKYSSDHDMHVKARDMLNFLDNHPAIGSPVFTMFNMLEFDIAEVCQNGQLKPHKGLTSVRYTPANYVRFKKAFDAEFKDYSEEELKLQKNFISIDVPYQDLFGYKWEPYRIEYWGELDFAVFLGKTFENSLTTAKWQQLSGIKASGANFQEMIVNLGVKFKKTFGNFDGQKLLTDKEKLNHKNQSPFLQKYKTETLIQIESNPKWIHVSPAEINRRWIKWFAMTPYARKHWLKETLRVLHGEETLY